MTPATVFDLTLWVEPLETPTLSLEQRKEVKSWFEAHSAELPDSVRIFITIVLPFIAGSGNLQKLFRSTSRELRLALGITPKSEKRPSGSPLSGLPAIKVGSAKSKREKLEARLVRMEQLRDWHRDLNNRHSQRIKRIMRKIAKMSTKDETPASDRKEKSDDDMTQKAWKSTQEITDQTPVEEIEIPAQDPEKDRADTKAFMQRMVSGEESDPAFQSVNETLMPGGSALVDEQHISLEEELPPNLVGAKLVETLTDERTRYDFSVTVTRINLEIKKKVVVDKDGERKVIAPSTHAYGPAGSSITWGALATLAILVGQFAIPYHRLAIMLSTVGKRFSASSLSRMLHDVARHVRPIYLALAKDLADCDVLAGDDTSCRVLEVSSYFSKSKTESDFLEEKVPPWQRYRTPADASRSIRACHELEEARVLRRESGDRSAKRTQEETPTLGMLIGEQLEFESSLRNGDGPKKSMNTTVISGRSVRADPRSLIVFYRSHLGGCGNLFESILRMRDPKLRKVILQGDLSPSNFVHDPDLKNRFEFIFAGCSAHARRPFANYEHEDPIHCSYMLHLFKGLAIYEEGLDDFGRNQHNVLAVRGTDSRDLWEKILDLSQQITERWSKATKIGAGAHYIINHYKELTAYLDDPRIEASNNMRERMLRTEKLIEKSSKFRKTLEGRFVLDVVRTVLQTAVAADVPVREYLTSILRTNSEDIARHPERYTPRAWAAKHLATDEDDDTQSTT